MKQASEQYRKEMQEPWRGQWLLSLYIGFVQERFQNSAVIDTEDELSFLSSTYAKNMFSNTVLDTSVATFEKDMFKADGSCQFMDAQHTSLDLKYYGIISEALSDENSSIDFSMTFTSSRNDRDLRGLTLYFVDTYPTLFNITAYSNGTQVFTRDYTNSSFKFETTDVFGEDADEMVLTVKKMNKPHVRFRMSYVLFGVGVGFTNENFLSAGGLYKESSHPCSVELPAKDLSITLDNYSGQYDIDKEGSLINLATVGQDVLLQVSYVKEDGSIEDIPSEKMELSRFDIDDGSMKIEAVDFLRNENAEIAFDDPSLFDEDTTLYDIAVVLKESIENENFTVILDDSLKDVPIKYTSIHTTCKEAFMMLSGAGRCTMSLTDKGLVIRRTNYDKSNLSIEASDTAPYSNYSQILDPDTAVPMASFEADKIRADGLSIYPGKTPSQSFKSGYISDAVSNLYGEFEQYPFFDVISEEVISTDYVLIRFNDCSPRDIIIETYYDDSSIETLELDDLVGNTVDLSYSFVSFNRMRIKVKSIYEGNRRVYVDYVSFDKKVYDITYDICDTNKPKLELEDTVRNIIVDYSNLQLVDGDYELVENSVVIPCNSKGTDVEYDNPFITTQEVAQDVGEWLREYYATQIFYDVSLIGDPTMQVGDIVRVPNPNNDNILADIEDNEIRFSNGGIRGKIRVRRRNNGLVRTKNRLAVR